MNMKTNMAGLMRWHRNNPRKRLDGYFTVDGKSLTHNQVLAVLEYAIEHNCKTEQDIPSDIVEKIVKGEIVTREKQIMQAAYKEFCNDPSMTFTLVCGAFKQGAVWADKHPFSSSREKILAMLDDKYGTDLSVRLKKLDEEYNELREAANRSVPNTLTLEHCVDYTRDILDELSDVNILIFHIAGIMGVSQDELLSMAVDKIKGREKDPNYKRKHPHK